MRVCRNEIVAMSSKEHSFKKSFVLKISVFSNAHDWQAVNNVYTFSKAGMSLAKPLDHLPTCGNRNSLSSKTLVNDKVWCCVPHYASCKLKNMEENIFIFKCNELTS